jgi:excisionase family DNA binding protein
MRGVNMNEEITVKEAAQLTGYSTEYIRELCRGGKIGSKKFGTTLVIEKVSILDYKQRQDQKRLSKEVSP